MGRKKKKFFAPQGENSAASSVPGEESADESAEGGDEEEDVAVEKHVVPETPSPSQSKENIPGKYRKFQKGENQ